MTLIRITDEADAEAIRDIHLSAFPVDESERIAGLALDLLSESTIPPTLSLVAEADGGIVGHAAFSPVATDGDNDFPGYLLAPFAVRPGCQKHGIGSRLVMEGLERLSQMNVELLLVYGDPEYYGRFGFRTDVAQCYQPPHDLKYPFGWQGILLADRQPANKPARIRCVPALCDPALW